LPAAAVPPVGDSAARWTRCGAFQSPRAPQPQGEDRADPVPEVCRTTVKPDAPWDQQKYRTGDAAVTWGASQQLRDSEAFASTAAAQPDRKISPRRDEGYAGPPV